MANPVKEMDTALQSQEAPASASSPEQTIRTQSSDASHQIDTYMLFAASEGVPCIMAPVLVSHLHKVAQLCKDHLGSLVLLITKLDERISLRMGCIRDILRVQSISEDGQFECVIPSGCIHAHCFDLRRSSVMRRRTDLPLLGIWDLTKLKMFTQAPTCDQELPEVGLVFGDDIVHAWLRHLTGKNDEQVCDSRFPHFHHLVL